MKLKRDVPRAAFREGLGEISLPYGRPGDPAIAYADGFGASHIAEKHGKESLAALPEMIAYGTLRKHADSNKRYITHGDRLVVLGRRDARHAWVISSFEDMKRTRELNS